MRDAAVQAYLGSLSGIDHSGFGAQRPISCGNWGRRFGDLSLQLGGLMHLRDHLWTAQARRPAFLSKPAAVRPDRAARQSADDRVEQARKACREPAVRTVE